LSLHLCLPLSNQLLSTTEIGFFRALALCCLGGAFFLGTNGLVFEFVKEAFVFATGGRLRTPLVLLVVRSVGCCGVA